MTKLDEMTNDEIWEQIEECFYDMHKDVANRCYPEHSTSGARHIQFLVRRHLVWIDRALLEIEIRLRQKRETVEEVLLRVEGGYTTAADAEFLREILSLNNEKVVPKPVKQPFGRISAR